LKTGLNILVFVASLLVALLGGWKTLRLYQARYAFRLAENLYYDSDRNPPPRCRERLETSIRRASGDPEPHYLLGRIAARERCFEDAVDHLQNAVGINPFDGRALYYLGLAFAEQGEREKASEAMVQAAETAQNNAALQFRVGYYFWSWWTREGRVLILEKAFSFFHDAAKGDLSLLKRILKTIEAYAFHYPNLVKVIPDTPEAHFLAARYLGRNRGLWKPALEEFEKAGSALEDRHDFLYERGLARLMRDEDPRDDLRRALRMAPDLATRRKRIREMSSFYRFADRIEEGLDFWRELEKAFPRNPAPAVNYAENALELAKQSMAGPMAEIEAERRKALQEAGGPKAKEEVNEFFTRKARAAWGKALADVEAYLMQQLVEFRDEALLWVFTARTLALQQRFDEAELHFRHAAEIGNHVSYWIEFVKFLLRRGKSEEAWKTAIRVKVLFPDDPKADAMAKLARKNLARAGENR